MEQKKDNLKLLKKIHFVKVLSYPFIYLLLITGIAKRNKKNIDRLLSLIRMPKSINHFLQRFEYETSYKNAFPKDSKTEKLAVFPMLMAINSNFTLLNLLLSSKLTQSGYKPVFFFCKSDLPVCSRERIGKTRKTNPFLCHECYTGYSRLSNKTGITSEHFNDYISAVDDEILKSELPRLENLKDLQQLSDYTYKNMPVGLISKKSVMRYFFSGELQNDKRTIDIFKAFIKTCIKTHLVFESYVKKHKNIGVVVIQNGTLATESIIIEVCTKYSIEYVTYERWIGNNSLLFKKNGKVMDLSWDDEWENYKYKELNSEQKQEVSNYALGLQSGKEMYARLNQEHHTENIKHLKKYVCLFTNLNFDTAVLEKHIAFKNMMQWIIEVINFWQTNNIEIGLIIRIHPGEVKLRTPSKEFAAEIIKPYIHSNNVVLLDSTDTVNSYNLIERMEFGLVYTSTIGLEIAYRGKPLLVAGESFYRDKPFAISPKTKLAYFETLKSLLEDASNFMPERDIVEKYIHFIYFHKTKRLNGMRIYTPNSESNSDHKDWKELLNANKDLLNEFVKTIN